MEPPYKKKGGEKAANIRTAQEKSFSAPSQAGKNKVLGTVVQLNSSKGFGFVSTLENSQRYFFHHSSVICEGKQHHSWEEVLKEGQQVMFDIVADERKGGDKAINVRPTTM